MSWPTDLKTRVTSNWRLAKAFPNMFDAWDGASAFVATFPVGYTVRVDWEPRIGAYTVEIFGEGAGPRRWLIY